jgi:hypothetical protein
MIYYLICKRCGKELRIDTEDDTSGIHTCSPLTNRGNNRLNRVKGKENRKKARKKQFSLGNFPWP